MDPEIDRYRAHLRERLDAIIARIDSHLRTLKRIDADLPVIADRDRVPEPKAH